MKPRPHINNALVANFISFVATKLIQKHFKGDSKKTYDYRNTDIVYHYTSFDSLYKIISSESLIASNALYLNDTREFRDSVTAFEWSLQDMLKKKNSKLSKAIIEAILSNIKNINVSENYVTCFSAEKDLLSQWMSYGDNGNGLAIGFDINELDSCFQYLSDGAWVEYDSRKMMAAADSINKEFINGYKLLVNNSTFDSQQQQIDLAVEIYLKHLMPDFLAHYKHRCFSEENEFRLALRESGSIPMPLSINFMTKNRSLIVPYTKFILAHRVNQDGEDVFLDNQPPTSTRSNVIGHLPIKEIILGPCVDREFTEPGLKMFLNSKGYSDIKISKSLIPLRNL